MCFDISGGKTPRCACFSHCHSGSFITVGMLTLVYRVFQYPRVDGATCVRPALLPPAAVPHPSAPALSLSIQAAPYESRAPSGALHCPSPSLGRHCGAPTWNAGKPDGAALTSTASRLGAQLSAGGGLAAATCTAAASVGSAEVRSCRPAPGRRSIAMARRRRQTATALPQADAASSGCWRMLVPGSGASSCAAAKRLQEHRAGRARRQSEQASWVGGCAPSREGYQRNAGTDGRQDEPDEANAHARR